nr:LPS assembly protein LptD [Marinobacter daqiaonensis]
MAQQTAAEMDWRPKAELPADDRDRLPAYCAGGYLQAGQGYMNPQTAADVAAPVTASALSARYEIDTELQLQGDVRLSQGGTELTSESARYDQRRGVIELKGPMTSRSQGLLLTGEEASYNVNSGYFELTGASFLLHDAEIRGAASRVSRPEAAVVRIEGGFLTTCAPGQNDWSLVASDIRLDQEKGFGTARHLRLQVRGVPVFYWPWATFPIDDRRKTGFLYPAFGTSNAGGGVYLSAPYYLNLASHYDATLTPQYIHGRGLFTEAEGRYLSRFGESVLQLGYIGEDEEFRDQYPAESGERWALDFYSRADFGSGWQGYADYSVVSDNDYLGDLNQTLDIGRATHLERRGGIAYQDHWQNLEAYVAGYQTLTDTVAEDDKPYDQLPAILYDARIPAGPFQMALDSQYIWFDRDNEGLTGLDRAVGQRVRAVPEVALPLRSAWGYMRPSVGVDQTWYDLDDYTLGDGDFDRTVPVAQWDSGLYFDRQTRLFGNAYNQSLEPRLYHVWADADSDQEHIPNFDSGLRSFRFDNLFQPNRFVGGDRVADANQTAVALTSRFHDVGSGAERARLSLGQLYYHDDREVALEGLGSGARSESPLAGEVVLRPLDALDLRVAGLWDPRENRTDEGRSQLVYHSPGYRYLASLGHTYSRGARAGDSFEQMDIGAIFPVSDRISLIGRWVYDSQLDRTVGTLAGIEYNDCCWSFQLVGQSYLTDDEELDNRIVFQIQLKGLGGAGGTGSTLSSAFYGYDEREHRRFGSRP